MAKEKIRGWIGQAETGLVLAGRGSGLIVFLLMPAVSYGLFEYVTGNLVNISMDMALLNIWWIAVFYLLVFVLSGSSRLAVPIVSVLLFLLSIAENFVVSFRGTPIMIWDVLAVSTAMSVAGNYLMEISEEMKNAGILLAGLNLLLLFFPVRLKGWRKRLAGGLVGTGAAVGFIFYFYTGIVPSQRLEINMWEMNSTYNACGYLLSTAVSLKYIVKKPPSGYSQARLAKLGAEYGEYPQPNGILLAEGEMKETFSERSLWESEDSGLPKDTQPVNLICIMNESLSDLRVAGDFTTNQPFFSFIDSLRENTVRGSLCVPVFGAMTSNSEYEFLTGDSVALLPSGSIAYQFYVKPDTYSLVSTLKDQGYYTVAMHPYPGENWNRDVCYPNMGFDEFLSGDYYTGCETFRDYVSDYADYQKIVQLVEQKENPDDRLFVFNVTMQNHGGYEKKDGNFSQDVFLTGSCAGKYPKTDQYLSLMKKSDEAFCWLLQYFRDYHEPTMIVMFGDHQPSVEDEFYDEIAGRPSAQVETEAHLMWYQTPFIIWTNYEQSSQDMGKLGAVYLSSHVLERANLNMTPYNRFLLEMSEKLPVVHPIGCYDWEGYYYSWEEAESALCPYQGMVMDYEIMAYNHSMDSKKADGLFRISE